MYIGTHAQRTFPRPFGEDQTAYFVCFLCSVLRNILYNVYINTSIAEDSMLTWRGLLNCVEKKNTGNVVFQIV